MRAGGGSDQAGMSQLCANPVTFLDFGAVGRHLGGVRRASATTTVLPSHRATGVGHKASIDDHNRPTRLRIVGGGMVVVAGGQRDAGLAQLAAAQRGLVSHRQLAALGFTTGQLRTLLRREHLHRVHRGVYAVGHTAPIALMAETAAILSFQGRAAISHHSALRLYGLIPPNARAPVEVVIPAATSHHARPGVTVHRSRTLTAELVRTVEGLPTTIPERALLDCAPSLTAHQLERALDEAVARRLVSQARLGRVLRTHGGHPGQAKLTVLAGARIAPAITESEAEARFLALVEAAGLPEPQMQVPLRGYRIDAYWPQAKLAVEIDGFRWHSTKSRFESDRRKQQVLQSHGIELTHTTWHQIVDDSLTLVAHLAGRLAARTEATRTL